MATRKNALALAEAALRKLGLSFPETTEDFPWGHRALKVKGKAFAFMVLDKDELTLSVKLPDSADFALMQPFAAPTGYGLGKSGWVTASFAAKDQVPVDLLGAWIRESYLAIAPKKIAAALSSDAGPAKAKTAPKAKPAKASKAKGGPVRSRTPKPRG